MSNVLSNFRKGIYATSRHIPGVCFAGIPHPGLIGTADLLAIWNKREGALIEAHPNEVPAVTYGPKVKWAYVGQHLDEELRQKIYREGARTIPGCEHGGNCDVSYFYLLIPVVWSNVCRSRICQGS